MWSLGEIRYRAGGGIFIIPFVLADADDPAAEAPPARRGAIAEDGTTCPFVMECHRDLPTPLDGLMDWFRGEVGIVAGHRRDAEVDAGAEIGHEDAPRENHRRVGQRSSSAWWLSEQGAVGEVAVVVKGDVLEPPERAF